MRTPTPCVLPTHPMTRVALLASGLTPAMVETQVARGGLLRIRRGVFLASAAWPTEEADRRVLMAKAEQVVHSSAVLSHASAALVWKLPYPGFLPWHDSPPAVTLPRDGRAKSRQGPVVHHVSAIPPGQVSYDTDGSAVTSPARTAVDLAAHLPLPAALVLLDGAARVIIGQMVEHAGREHFANPRLRLAAADLLREAARGKRSASLPAHISLSDPSRESAAESLSAGYFHLAGIPTPLFQHPIKTRTGTYFPDFYWEEQRLIGECDGARKYTDPRDLVKEKVREDSLREIGNRFVRWLGGEIMTRPPTVVDRIWRGLGM